MQIFNRLRRLAAVLVLVPLCAGFQPVAAAQRTETANVRGVVSLASPRGIVSGALGSWLQSVPPANGNPLYMTTAIASSTDVTDSISATEWTVPVVVSETLTPGAPAPGNTTVLLYQRGASAPAAPSGTFTFTFSTAVLSGGTPNGWSQTVPATDGNPLWVIGASASSPTDTDSIAATEFSTAVKLAGDTADGLNIATVRLYQRVASAPATPGDTLTYTFPAGLVNVPKSVRSDLLLASDGNIYFAASAGGAGFGAVGRLTPDGVLSTLYAFADGNEGLSAFGGLVQASDGNLYGTTYFGGHDSYGTVFKLTLTGEFTVLHEFTKTSKSPKYPYTGLVEGPDGNLYGTTRIGGDHNKGAIYRISTAGTYSVAYSFSGGDGTEPQGRLIVGPDGLLYGTTMLGGSNDRGVIYRISTAGAFERLYSFPSLSAFNSVGIATNATGANPRSGLLLAADGNFYGTTYQGGPHGNGTLFRATVTGGSADVAVVHAFEGTPFDGGFPLAAPVQGPDGAFYGTTERGGYTDSGSAWKVAADGSSEMLHSFAGTVVDGLQPYASLLFANDALYGVSDSDDTAGAGAIFKLEQDSGSGLPVEFTVTQRQIELNGSVTLTWNAPNAVSCDKFGSWDEPTDPTDTLHITPVSGSMEVGPGIGVYTYGLACTDAANVVHNAYVGVYITAPVLDTVDGGKIVGGGAVSWLLLALLLALLFVKLIKETRSSCP